MELERLQVVISANIAPLQKSLNDVKGRLNNLDKQTKRIGDSFSIAGKAGKKAFDGVFGEIKDAIDSVKEYNKALKEVADYTSKYELFGDPAEQPWKKSITWLNEQLNENLKTVGELNNAIKDLDQSTLDIGENYVGFGTALDNVRQLNALLNELFANREDGMVQFNATLVDLAVKSAATKEELEELTLDFEELQEAVELAKKATDGSISVEEYQKMNEALGDMSVEQAEAKMEEYKAKIEELGLAYSQLRREIDATIKVMGGLDAAATMPNVELSTHKLATLEKVLFALSNGLSSFQSAALQVASAIGMIGKTALQATAKLGKMLWQLEPVHKILGKVGSAIQSLGQRIRRVFVYSTIISFFRALKTEIGSFMTANTELMNSLAQAKGAWITAFMPIYNTVIPIIISLVNWLTVLGQKIALLTHRIFGGSIGASKAQAKALKELGGAAGGAAAEFKPIIAAFDELNRLEEPDAGGGGAGSDFDFGFEDIDESALKEYLTWYDWLFDKTQKIIALHKELDKWLQKCANTINWFFTNVLQMFRGDNDQMAEAMINQWREMGKTLAEAINHFVESVDWTTVGRALGAGLDLALNYLVSFVKTFNWKGLGQAIAKAINGAISEIDWTNVGRLLAAAWNIVWQFFVGFVTTIDWRSLGNAIADVINGALQDLDVNSFEAALLAICQGLLDLCIGIVEQLDWGALAEKLFLLLIAAIRGAAGINNLWLLGIGIGGDLQDKIKKGFDDSTPNFQKSIDDNLDNTERKHHSAWERIFGTAKTDWDNIKQTITDKANTIKENTSEKFNNLKEKVSQSATNTKSAVIGAFTALSTGLASPLASIVGQFASAWGSVIKETASDFGTLISNIGGYVTTIGTSISNMLSTIGSGISSAWGSISNFVASALAQLASVKIPAMASGGVITKPTVGLIGEYSGAKTNPEIVTPEKLLRNIVGESNDDVAETLIAVGRQIVEAIQDNNIEVKIGDDVISAAAARGNKNYMKRTGRSQFA